MGSKGTQLFLRQDENPLQGWSTNANTCSTLTTSNIDCLVASQNAKFGDVTEVKNDGFSTYDSLQASITKRYDRTRAGDFTFTGAYTWSHMIDNASEIFGPTFQFLGGATTTTGGTSNVANGDFAAAYYHTQSQGLQAVDAITPFAQSATDLKDEKASSSFDRRQRFSTSYLWEPFPTKNMLMRGWQLNGVFTYQSGQPFSPLNGVPSGLCADANGDGILTNDRPAIGNPRAPLSTVALLNTPNCSSPTSANGSYINSATLQTLDPANADFVQVPLGVKAGTTFNVGSETYKAGSAGRNSLVGPNIAEWDAALMKNFHFGESRVLQFRWEVYDALNHQNPGFTIGNVFAANAQTSPSFAFSQSATPASVTGVLPENAFDATAVTKVVSSGSTTFPKKNSFLSQQFMNTSSRTMQFGVKFTF